jgi:hypothetical protein
MDRPDAKTTTWTSDELGRIEAAEELEVAPRRRDGTLSKPVPIWVVRVDDEVYVRAAYGPGTGWHRVARASREGRIRAGGVEKDVTIEDADGAVNDQVDAAYRAKYRRYAGSIVDGITNAQARTTTLKLAPRAQSDNSTTTGRDVLSTDQGIGRVAVITGASSGIGEATARALAADGHPPGTAAPSPSRPTSPTATRSSRRPRSALGRRTRTR